MRVLLSRNSARAIVVSVAFLFMGGFHLTADPIDRLALVRRHNPVIRKADALEPLSVGNGAFAFSVDVTGLQTFPDFYEGHYLMHSVLLGLAYVAEFGKLSTGKHVGGFRDLWPQSQVPYQSEDGRQ